MSGIQPQTLTDKELAHYADLMGADKLPVAWIQELIKRLAAK
jgi:hypothetical protein